MFSEGWKTLLWDWFVDRVYLKRAILLIFYVELTESVLDILSYAESTVGPIMVGPREKFHDKCSQKAGKHCFEIGL